jgi:hypothetical protein
MTREEFSYLYVNANCLAELGLRRAVACMHESDCQGIHGQALGRVDEMDPETETAFDELDFTALNGLDFFGGDSSESNDLTETLPVTDAADVQMTASETCTSDDDKGGDFDIGAYMNNSYAARETVQDQIDVAYAKADIARLDMLIAEMPVMIPALTRRLSGAEVETCLTLYDVGDETLVEAVTLICQSRN